MGRLYSIIVPVYNVEKYLDKCVKSIVDQTYRNLEIILVDDGSPDNCPKICDRWAKKDNRIKVIHKENGGLSSARNCAIRQAKGEYYFLVDSDDYIVQDAVEMMDRYISNEDVIIGEALIYEDGKVIHRVHTNLEKYKSYKGRDYSIKAISAGEWFAAACYNVYRTQFIIDNELFFKEGILHEDIEYVPRLFLKAGTVKYVPFQFYRYVTRGDSICGTKSKKHLHDLFQTYAGWKVLNDSITDKELYEAYAGALSKYFISTCRQYTIKQNIYPKGMNGKYLLMHSLNTKEKIKTVLFLLFRNLYVRL